MLFDPRVCRSVAFAVCLAGVNGCAVLPPAMQQGYALLSGISYLATSKGPADHAISIAMREDCAPWRPLLGKAACVPVSRNTNRPLLANLVDVLHAQPDEPPAAELFTEFPPPVDLRIPPGSAAAQTY